MFIAAGRLFVRGNITSLVGGCAHQRTGLSTSTHIHRASCVAKKVAASCKTSRKESATIAQKSGTTCLCIWQTTICLHPLRCEYTLPLCSSFCTKVCLWNMNAALRSPLGEQGNLGTRTLGVVLASHTCNVQPVEVECLPLMHSFDNMA
jgi:hypothetical protein